jgi:FlaA1/EpsC-like NDP-sugar epimerase/lipopolysaccharide/colanic/teichoic acid biosynthesis glycosyltransferase
MISGKRLFDLVGSGLALLVSAPLFVLIALVVKLEDGGPVFFLQERVGRKGRLFRIRKFRTMRAAAHPGLPLTVAGDQRITRAGRWLRRFKLDELPQLLHVLRGEMSLVGPRPEVPGYVAHYTSDLLAVLDHPPGLTDPASVEGWDEGEVLARTTNPERAYLDEVMPAKVRRQLGYASGATIRSDFLVLLATICHPWDAVAPLVVSKMVKYRRGIIMAVHVVLVTLSYRYAYELRFDFQVPPIEARTFWYTLPVLLCLRLLMYERFGLNGGYWKHFSTEDLFRLGVAVTLSSTIFVAVLAMVAQVIAVPRSVVLMDVLGSIFLVGGTHLVARWLQEGRLRLMPRPGRRTLVVGTGDNAERLLREVLRSGERAFDFAGLVTEEPTVRGRSIHGVRIVGTVENLPALASQFDAELVIIALERPSAERLERIVERCAASGVEFRTLPSLDELLAGTARPDQLRTVELEDLLGREPVRLDSEAIRGDLADKIVLVTGGAGSIGSELARQVAGFAPAQLILVDQAESPLYFTHLDLLRTHSSVDIVPVICDVTDGPRMTQVFARYRPDYVLHAAAYKHVPLMESNPVEAVRNNVVGTLVTARAAATFGASKFVLISTDKAVNPSSVMGATKRAAERLVLGLPALRRSVTQYRVVRFGNVLGSAGSVVPLFERQLGMGQPITLTHPDAERYFMTIPEAAALVLQAATIKDGRGRVCMLDMGKPVRIVELARKMIALSGRKEGVDARIVFTGLRPGEKVREELICSLETSVATSIPKIRLVQAPDEDGGEVSDMLARILRAQGEPDPSALVRELAAVIPEYTPPFATPVETPLPHAISISLERSGASDEDARSLV